MRVIEIIRDAEGGMKTHFTTLTKGLAEQGIDVTAICNFEERCKKDLEAAGIRVISFSFHKTIRPLSDCIAIFKLVSIIRKMKPDIVHCHGFKAGLLGRLAGRITGAKLLYTVHNFVTYGRGICTSLLIRYFESWMGSRTHGIICVSRALKKSMMEEMGLDEMKLFVIYNSIPDWPAGNRRVTRKIHCIEGNHILIGTAARLIPSKGIEILLRAASGILSVYPHVRLLIAGSGPQESGLKELARILGVEAQVVFTGRGSDMHNYYAAFDIFVLPTLTEGLGITVLEAMSFGLPVIASSVGGIPEFVIHKKNGILVQPGNVFELRTALQFLLDNPIKTRYYGYQAKTDIQKGLTRDQMIEQTVSVLNTIYHLS